MESANTKWRQWKSKLFKDFVQPNKDHPEKLKDPPPESNIPRDDWNKFVLDRVTGDFKVNSANYVHLDNNYNWVLFYKLKHYRGDYVTNSFLEMEHGAGTKSKEEHIPTQAFSKGLCGFGREYGNCSSIFVELPFFWILSCYF